MTRTQNFAEMIKDIEMGRRSWILQVSTKCQYMYPYKWQAEGDWIQKRGRQCDYGGGRWSDVTTGQGLLAATTSWKKQGRGFPLEALQGMQ